MGINVPEVVRRGSIFDNGVAKRCAGHSSALVFLGTTVGRVELVTGVVGGV